MTFKKGHKPWNKGKRRVNVPSYTRLQNGRPTIVMCRYRLVRQ